jgi:hypothetical protein
MPPLHHIVDVNLISARLHGVELDLEDNLAWFEECIESMRTDRAAADKRFACALHQFEDTLLGVLLHAWPEPADPVVMALRKRARVGLAWLRQLRQTAE